MKISLDNATAEEKIENIDGHTADDIAELKSGYMGKTPRLIIVIKVRIIKQALAKTENSIAPILIYPKKD